MIFFFDINDFFTWIELKYLEITDQKIFDGFYSQQGWPWLRIWDKNLFSCKPFSAKFLLSINIVGKSKDDLHDRLYL